MFISYFQYKKYFNLFFYIRFILIEHLNMTMFENQNLRCFKNFALLHTNCYSTVSCDTTILFKN